jgi:hypothetical protein
MSASQDQTRCHRRKELASVPHPKYSRCLTAH